MAKKGNKYKIGALALLALAILVIGLLSLGIMKYFQPEILFMTATDNSVQGLKVGSNVKIKGVPIGSVKDIKIGLKGETIYITMKLDISAVLDQTQDRITLKRSEAQRIFDQKAEGFIRAGLRCQLQYEGITGDMYVDLAYFNPKEYPVIERELPEHHPIYVSLIPTPTIGNILQTTQDIAKKLNDVNLKKITDDFDNLIISLDDFSAQLREIANRDRMNDLRDSIIYSLDQLNKTMASVTTLANTLQKQPDSVIWGKAGSKVVPSLENQ